MAHILKKAWTKYCELLITRPLVTKGLTGGSLFATGDLIAQYIDGTLASPEGYNPKRTAIGFCWSAFGFTPVGHHWYTNVLPRYFPKVNAKSVVSKVVVDQTIFSSLINVGYLSYTTLAHGNPISQIPTTLQHDYWNVLKANWTLWPAVQLFNFYLVPIPLQMPVMNIAVLFWSSYLATVSAKRQKDRQEQSAAATASQLPTSTLLANDLTDISTAITPTVQGHLSPASDPRHGKAFEAGLPSSSSVVAAAAAAATVV